MIPGGRNYFDADAAIAELAGPGFVLGDGKDEEIVLRRADDF